ncbi:MAG: cytochrome c oxidase subunit II, partial [Steroidobacteraceae bacterium]
ALLRLRSRQRHLYLGDHQMVDDRRRRHFRHARHGHPPDAARPRARACAMNLQAFMTEASAHAASIDRIFILLVVISSFITLLVCVLLAVFSIRYRKGSQVDRGRLPKWMQSELEVGWTAATFFLFLFIFWWAAASQLSALTPPSKALEIHVVAKQWMWKVQQPNGVREINEMHVPVGEPVRLVMTSEDVIHSMFLPALRIKRDVLPGRYAYLWFTAAKTGTYQLECAELCGTEHSRMTGRLVVMPQGDYAHWSAAAPEADTLAKQGERLFHSLGCSGCHAPNATVHAPDLDGLYGKQVHLSDGQSVTADDAYIRDSILQPSRQITAGYPPIMPSFSGIVGEDEIVKLVAYIKSLSAKAGQR